MNPSETVASAFADYFGTQTNQDLEQDLLTCDVCREGRTMRYDPESRSFVYCECATRAWDIECGWRNRAGR